MHPSVAPLAIILDLNTDLLLNCLDEISEAESARRLPGGGNSVAFLAAHLTDSRYFLAARLGHLVENPIAKYLEGARTIDEIREWPSLDELRAAWLDVSTHLQRVLSTLTEADLARTNAHRFPVADSSRLGFDCVPGPARFISPGSGCFSAAAARQAGHAVHSVFAPRVGHRAGAGGIRALPRLISSRIFSAILPITWPAASGPSGRST